jgi:AhpD family alkylhydroperoxidase
VVAAVNGCDYCMSAHTYLGSNLAKLHEVELAANRRGRSNDTKADAAVTRVRLRRRAARSVTRTSRR